MINRHKKTAKYLRFLVTTVIIIPSRDDTS
nr:MAG TPA: hypothetical protein [Caudoviricetes sp.]